ncbi:polysaccharide pyruvyl transferase family protein [Vibrio lentus]
MYKAVLLNDTSHESHHGCEVVVENIIEQLTRNDIEVIATNPVGLNWRDNELFMNAINDCDIVIVNGEGTIHHSQKRAKELTDIAPYVKDELGKSVVLINSTFQDNNNDIIEAARHFDLIFVRESLSQRELESYNIRATVVPDMTFFSDFDLKEKKIDENTYAITDSVYLELSEEMYRFSIDKGLEYLPALTHPNHERSGDSYLKIFKYKLFHLIKKVLQRYNYPMNHYTERQLFYTENYRSYIGKIANLDGIICGRYHSLCFSLKTMTPFYALESNSHKVPGMLEDIGIIERRVSANNLAVANLPPRFTAEEKVLIGNYVAEAKKSIERMFLQIKSYLNENCSKV